MIPETATIEEIRALFAQDRFASEACGATIVQAGREHAVCEMEVTSAHLNAAGSVMGGAIFTLADFALAVACNIGHSPTVAINNNIQFISTIKGSKLIAECSAERSGRTVGFYTVKVSDELGTAVAVMNATCHRND